MKKLFTLIISLSFTYFSKGQSDITGITAPAFGSTISAQVKTDNTVNPGSSGNQTWDFSSLNFTETPTTSTIVNPATTSSASSFTSATIAEEASSGSQAFYIISSSEQTLLGNYDATYDLTVAYSDPLTMVSFPISYNTTAQTDNYAASYSANGFPITISGNVSTVYDGYGTIKTMNGTYNNVSRLKLTRNETQSINYGYPIGTVVIQITTVAYSWVVPGNYTPIFAINDITTTSSLTGTTSAKLAYLYNSEVTATKNSFIPNLKITAGPNPATETVSVDFNDVETGSYNLTVINDKGTPVLEENIYAASGDSYKLNVKELTNGFYVIKVLSSNGEFEKKFIKH